MQLPGTAARVRARIDHLGKVGLESQALAQNVAGADAGACQMFACGFAGQRLIPAQGTKVNECQRAAVSAHGLAQVGRIDFDVALEALVVRKFALFETSCRRAATQAELLSGNERRLRPLCA